MSEAGSRSKSTPSWRQGLLDAVEYFGGSKVAFRLRLQELWGTDITAQKLHFWLTRATSIPPEVCRHIEFVTRGEVRAADMLPEVYEGATFYLRQEPPA